MGGGMQQQLAVTNENRKQAVLCADVQLALEQLACFTAPNT